MLVVVVSALAARALHSRPRKLGTSSRTGSGQQVSAQQIRLGSGIITNLALGNVGAVDHVEPVAQAVTGLCDLQLDGANDGVVVSRVQVALLQGSGAVGHDDGADVGVGVAGPAGGRGDDIVDVVAGDPAGGLGLVGAGGDVADEGVGPGLGVGQGVAANQGLGDVSVPVGVQVVAVALVGDLDVVSANLVGLIVERLGQVANEVDEELEGLLDVGGGEAAVSNALGVVGHGRDGAARAAAVAVIVDVAVGGRAVLGVDEVEGSRPLASGGCSVVVSPRGDVGQV